MKITGEYWRHFAARCRADHSTRKERIETFARRSRRSGATARPFPRSAISLRRGASAGSTALARSISPSPSRARKKKRCRQIVSLRASKSYSARKTTGRFCSRCCSPWSTARSCQTCSDACHIYEASGRNEVYRPTVPQRDLAPSVLQVREAWRAALAPGSTAISS